MKFVSQFSEPIRKYIEKEIFEEQIYALTKTSKDNPIIIDCGSNVGYSIAYFKQAYPDAEIYGFEPDELAFKLLKYNIAANNLANVHIQQLAVTDVNDFIPFFTVDNHSTNPPVMSAYKNNLASHEVRVRSISLGDFVSKFSCIDFCKIDVEGAESLILNSLLADNSIIKFSEFVIEYHHWTTQEYSMEKFISLFEKNGFICTIIKEEKPVLGWPTSGNTLLRMTNSQNISC